MYRSSLAVVFVAWVFSSASGLGADDAAVLLATARDGNRSAIRSIQTMECKYERIPWDGTTLEQAKKYYFVNSGFFWQSGEAYRCIDPIDDGTTREYLVREGRILVIRKGGPLARPILSIGTRRQSDGIGGEIWQYLLFSHWGWLPPPQASFYPFYDIVQRPHTIHTIKRLDDKQIYVELSHAGGRLAFWLDPKVNYLIRKCTVVVASSRDTYRHEHKVVAFAEPAPGVFVPTTIEHQGFVNGKLQATVRTLLTNIKVNHRLADAALRIPDVAGMECIDLDRDVKYKVDVDGNRVGPETKVTVVRHAPKPGDQMSEYSPQAPSKPLTPLWVWILVGAAVILLIGIALAIWRRRASALTT